MSQRSLLIWVCGAAALLAACGSTSVRSATPSPATTDGGGSAPRGTPPAGVPGGTGAEPPPAISATEPPSVATALPSGEACTSNPAPVFTHHYTDLDQIDFINPTIVTSGNWLKNRQYHKVVTDAQNNAPEVPVYAPVDAVATGVTYYLGRMVAWHGTSFDLAQYDLRFRVSCELTYGFDHVSRLAEPFALDRPARAVPGHAGCRAAAERRGRGRPADRLDQRCRAGAHVGFHRREHREDQRVREPGAVRAFKRPRLAAPRCLPGRLLRARSCRDVPRQVWKLAGTSGGRRLRTLG